VTVSSGAGRVPARGRRLSWREALSRGVGYPAPSYVLWGALPQGCFAVQAALPGRPHALTDPATVDQLVALCDLQAGRGGWLAEAFPARPPWAEEVVHAVTRGFAEHDYCVIGSLRAHSPATAELLRVVQAFVKRHADEIGDDHVDIVHFDFSPANLLRATREGWLRGPPSGSRSTAGSTARARSSRRTARSP
jgi:hypothetical protein